MEKEVKRRSGKHILNFGKYKGKTVEYVLDLNPDYIIWAHNTIKWFKVTDKIYDDALILANERMSKRRVTKFNYAVDVSDYVDIYGYDIYD